MATCSYVASSTGSSIVIIAISGGSVVFAARSRCVSSLLRCVVTDRSRRGVVGLVAARWIGAAAVGGHCG